MTCVAPEGSRRAKAIARFARCQSGIAAVEFALVLPVLILLLLGSSELTRALTYDRKVTQVAFTVGDLVAQSDSVSATDMTDIFEASDAVMQPYEATGLGMIVSSVSFDEDSKAKVEWSCASGSTAWTTGGAPPIEIPASLQLANTSLIVSVSSYPYKPIFTAIIPSSIDMGETFYLRPRLVDTIPDPGC
ncbi:Flp pilus assembly protein TadG [Breoghania corrubedonensis]|uniref:Flp pilus assembly protein TadG n=1 Tax=Breoghania corrubedonensis TaxID=665038 RepID=A0A2T5VG22_9HYPH|nr:TadE/TadG family type IV pilus assembly protein [Breoghania corrubedonensis]PTW62703.1 Flp pilus assembly protein TadG [Breoghania corrubedonensis]